MAISVIFYEHANFGGKALEIHGTGEVADLRNIGGNGNQWNGAIHGGGRWVHRPNPSSWGEVGDRHWWHDRISSFRVMPGYKVEVFANIHYSGDMFGDWVDNDQNALNCNDCISAFRVAKK